MASIYSFLFDRRMSGNYMHLKSIVESLSSEYTFVVFSNGKSGISDKTLLNLRHFFKFLYIVDVLCNAFVICGSYLIDKFVKRRDILVFHVFGGANVAPILAAKMLRVPVIWTLLETTGNYKGIVKSGLRILKSHNFVITVVAKSIVRAYDLNNTVFIPCSVDREFWHLNNERHFADDEPISILSVGNINPLKGYDTLLQALKQCTVNFSLQIVGASLHTQKSYQKWLFEEAKSINESNKSCSVTFLGLLDSQQIKELMSNCDIFIMPSISEAAPIALLEAMSMGCFCIATDVGDIADYLKIYGRGQLVSAGNASELAHAINSYNRYSSYITPVVFPDEFSSISMAREYSKLYSTYAKIK